MTTHDLTQRIDWQSIRESLNWDVDAQHRDLLRRRAEQYGMPLQRAESPEGAGYLVLRFRLGDEDYGIDATLVKSVRAAHRITPVPATPHFYRGVVNIRGQIITVLDLQRFFGIDSSVSSGELVIVSANKLEIGLLASEVKGVSTVPTGMVRTVDTVRYARGVTADRMILLDLAQMFEDDRLISGSTDE